MAGSLDCARDDERVDLPSRQLARNSEMLFPFHKNHFLLLGLIATIVASSTALAQPAQPEVSSTPSASPSATPIFFADQTLADLKQLRQAALASDYAFKQVAHLANNIGPRLTGSVQAAKAVEYVADEMKALGCNVQLEKVMVPHWVRGVEIAELTQFPGQAAGTTQRIVLCALGGSVATPPEGINADTVCVRDFEELKLLSREKVNGKIVLFIIHSTNKWRRKVMVVKPTGRPWFIEVTVRWRRRNSARPPV